MAERIKEVLTPPPAKKVEFVPEGIRNDKLEKPVIFVSGEKEAKIKIPGLKVGEVWLPTPVFAEFKDYKYACHSSYIAGVLRRKCAPANIIELKD